MERPQHCNYLTTNVEYTVFLISIWNFHLQLSHGINFVALFDFSHKVFKLAKVDQVTAPWKVGKENFKHPDDYELFDFCACVSVINFKQKLSTFVLDQCSYMNY